MAKSMLHETVCVQSFELWPTVCYIKLFVCRDLKCGQENVK